MHVTPIATSEGLADLSAEWNVLAGGSPLCSWAWLAGWWRHYGQGSKLRVLAVFDAGQLQAVAPLYGTRSNTQGHVLRFLGSGEVCTDHATILCADHCREAAVEAIAEYLAGPQLDTGWFASHRDDRWDLLELTGVDQTDAIVASLVERLQQRGCGVHARPGLNCWRLELPDTWEGYLASLSKSHRKQVRRVEQRLLGAGRAVLHMARTLDELPTAFATFVDLHQRRRKSLGEPGCFASSRFAAFLPDVASDLMAAEKLRLFWLELDGRPVAAEFQMAGDGVVYAYQSGVEPDVLEDQPGRIITIATLQQAIAEGFREFDFMRGDEPYKAHWRAAPQASVEYRVAAPRTLARWRQSAWIATQNLKQMARQRLRPADHRPPEAEQPEAPTTLALAVSQR
ncbi:MAG: GNAT family N-acetyltransferase [Pirellulales bacterium]